VVYDLVYLKRPKLGTPYHTVARRVADLVCELEPKEAFGELGQGTHRTRVGPQGFVGPVRPKGRTGYQLCHATSSVHASPRKQGRKASAKLTVACTDFVELRRST
jgi:hypothetical protein